MTHNEEEATKAYKKFVANTLKEMKKISPQLESQEDKIKEQCDRFILLLEKIVAGEGKIEPEYLENVKSVMQELLESMRKYATSLTPDFLYKLNGTAINKLTRLKPKKSEMDVSRLSKEATFKRGDFTLKFTDFTKIAGLKTSTHQLLDALMIQRTEQGGKDLTIRLTLDDFMDMRGLKDRKEARKQVDADLETLFNARLSWTENTGKKGKDNKRDYLDMRLITAKGINKGVITVTLTPEFAQILENYYPMPYSKQTLQLSARRNPNSYYFLNCIQQHKNMNVGKKNENLISVQTLLESTPDIPTFENVANKNRRYQELIIEPFERDMDAIDATLTWEYCHTNGQPLTDEELDNMDYYVFEKLLVQVYWRNYPDQSERLARKAEKKAMRTRKKNSQ